MPEPPRIALRPSTPADDDLQNSWVASAYEVERFAGPSLRFPLTREQLQAFRDDPAVHTFTAYLPPDAGTAIARLDIARVAPTTGRLSRVIVDPARRGQGLARPIVGAAVAWAREHDFDALTLAVFKDNPAALRTYQAVGFTERAEHPTDDRIYELRAALRPS